MNARTPVAGGQVARSSRSRFRWGLALLAVATLPAASLLGAADASAAPPPTITIEYDGNYVNFDGAIGPSVVIRGSGFSPAAAGTRDILLAVHIYDGTPGASTWFGFDPNSTLAGKVCTGRVCTSYQAGELRPFRFFLSAANLAFRGRAPQCGDLLTARGKDNANTDAAVDTKPVTFRVPCFSKALRSSIPATP